MRDHAHLRPQLAIFVEINTPRIAASFGEDFKFLAARMITPNTGIHPLPLAGWSARPADVTRAKHTMTTVKPAIQILFYFRRNFVGAQLDGGHVGARVRQRVVGRPALPDGGRGLSRAQVVRQRFHDCEHCLFAHFA